MKKRSLFLLSIFVFTTTIHLSAQDKPNIILVITDDQGTGDLGCNGNPYIKTPSIDKFANDAVQFTNFHVSTTCAPTRGALLSGRHSNRINAFHTISGRSMVWDDEVLLSEILAMNGYTNGMFGKWHLGDNYPYRPEDRGFHEVVRHGGGGISQMPDYWGNDYFDDHYWHNGSPEAYEGYCTDVFFGQALKFIEENKDEPFFCYISTNAPHGPLNVPEKYIDLYEDIDKLSENQKRFYGMISNIDENFALLQKKMKKWGIEENTILIFMTDNGTASGANVYGAGLRGKKGSEYEGGHRVPFMLQWPAKEIGGGRKVNELTAHFDFLPTLLDMIDLKYTPAKNLDGTSLKPLLTTENADWENRILYVDTQRLQNLIKGRHYSVMDNNWRLVNGDELYDINKDMGQEENVIDDNPEVARTLAESYERWWSSIISEGVNERYAYIKAGTPYENPVRICSHDMLTGNLGHAWHQDGAVKAVQTTGCWKIEITESGNYRFHLRRFPVESELEINAEFEAQAKERRLQHTMPASNNVGFDKAYLFIADFKKTVDIKDGAKEVVFEMTLPEGKFDMEAHLIDELGRHYPSYYVDIEKL